MRGPYRGPVAHPPELPLDLEQRREERRRRQGGLDRDRRVEEPGLVEVADRVGLAERRHADDVDLRALAEELDRARQRRRPVAEIRSEPYVGARHHGNLKHALQPAGERCTYNSAMRISPVVVAAALVAACARVARRRSAAPARATMLVELQPPARCTEATTVARAGGTLDRCAELGLYLVPSSCRERGSFRTLRARGALRFAAPNRPAGTLAVDRLLRSARPDRMVARGDRRRRPDASPARAARDDRRLRPRRRPSRVPRPRRTPRR